jgi:diguanylate cyclase (GGDEF)-like protein
VIETEDITRPFTTLNADEPKDVWFFEIIGSDQKYVLTINLDHEMQRKRVWLDYRIEKNGTPLGVISTGLEFSHVAGEIFSQFESNNMRGIIIDRNETIYMDSSLMENNVFLYDLYTSTLREEFADPAVIRTVEEHLHEADGFWDEIGEPGVTRLSPGQFRLMTIAPIKHTEWSIIILSDTTTLFDTTYFVPVMIAVLTLLIAFAMVSSIVSYRILFKPLKNLDDSLLKLNEHNAENIFGAERDDELGHLSNTIQDLFNKANIDPLTGLYNRRFMDSSMERVMGLLSRSDGLLSVLMLDIDFFKRYNDTYGHEAGDKCLQAVAHALSDSVSRVNDVVVRYGGEEFAIILPNTDSEGARSFAEKLQKNVNELNIPHDKNEAAPYVTVSIGITTGKVERKHDLSMYLKRADEALYMSKESGRNRFTYLEL